MPFHRFPSPDLTFVIRTSSSDVVPAIPLKPSSGVFRINPAFRPPNRQRLGSVDPEEIQRRVVTFRTKPRIPEPASGKLIDAIGHVFAAENPHFEHLHGGQFGQKVRMKIFPDRFSRIIDVILLHEIVYDDLSFLHGYPSYTQINLPESSPPGSFLNRNENARPQPAVHDKKDTAVLTARFADLRRLTAIMSR